MVSSATTQPCMKRVASSQAALQDTCAVCVADGKCDASQMLPFELLATYRRLWCEAAALVRDANRGIKSKQSVLCTVFEIT